MRSRFNAVRVIHTKVFDDKEIAKYQPDWKKQGANAVERYNIAIDDDSAEGCVVGRSPTLCRSLCQTGSKVYITSKILFVAKLKLVGVLKKKVMSKPKMRPLEKLKFGGASMLTSLTASNYEILGNLTPFGQDLLSSSQILCLQCTVMVDLVDGFHKKTPRIATPALRIFWSFTIKSMSADHEVQELLREFEPRGLQNLMSTPPASPPREETPPASNQPMQT